MIVNETFVDGLGNVAVQAALARIELTQLSSLPAEGAKPDFQVCERLVMSIETFLKMYQSFSEVISQMEAKGLIRKTDSNTAVLASPKLTAPKAATPKKVKR